MLIFDIPLIIIGAVLILYGALIFFKKRHDLIGDYDKNRSEYTEGYPARLGLIEFIGGLVSVGLGVSGIFVDNIYYSAATVFSAPLLILTATAVNTKLSRR